MRSRWFKLAALTLSLLMLTGILAGCSLFGAKPVTLTDDAGRSVTLKKAPQRIISGAPSNTEILFAIGLGDKVVGVEDNCDYPEAAKSITKIGNGYSVKQTNFEQIVALKPDLFLAIKGQTEVVAELERLGIPVYVVDSPDLAGIIADIRTIGNLTGASKKATEVADEMQRRLDAVQAKLKGLTDEQRPLVFYEVWNEPLMTAGPETFVDNLITLAGGRNAASDTKPGSWPEYSLETLIKKDPAVVVTTFADAASVAARPGWSGIKAVKDGRVLLVDQNIVVRPGPRILDGLEQFAKAFHPDLFK